MKTADNNTLVLFEKHKKPFNVFHTHVIDRAIMDAAVAGKKSLEVDVSMTPEGTIYVGHPLSYYKGAGLPPPSNLPLETIAKEAKAAVLVNLIL